MRNLRNLTLVQFLSQRNMQPSMVLKFKTVSLNLLVYFKTVQKVTESTAGADLSSSVEILISVDSFSFPASFFPATPPKTLVQISLYFLRYFVFLKQ